MLVGDAGPSVYEAVSLPQSESAGSVSQAPLASQPSGIATQWLRIEQWPRIEQWFRLAYGGSGDPNTLDPFDADSDGMVGLADFAMFRQNFGQASDAPA